MQKMLELSTCHIPKHTSEALGSQGTEGVPALWNEISYVHYLEYGWIIFCSSEAPDGWDLQHPELANLIKIAHDLGASYLKLDCDALTAQGLPTFDW